MKKIVLLLIFIFLINGLIYADEYLMTEKEKNNHFIMIDIKWNSLFFLNFGISYEHRLTDHFSLFYHADIITLLVFQAMGLNAELHNRWYPLSNELNNLYISLGIGYGRFLGDGQLNIPIRIGWKVLKDGLITEPFIGYTYSPGGFSQFYLGFSSGWSF
jgi:hypothetical protein